MASIEHMRHSPNGIEHRMFLPSHKRSTYRFRETPPSHNMGTESDTQEKSQNYFSHYGPIPIGLDPSLLRGGSPQLTASQSTIKSRRTGPSLSLSNPKQWTQHTASTAEPQIPVVLGRKTTSHVRRTMTFQETIPTVEGISV